MKSARSSVRPSTRRRILAIGLVGLAISACSDTKKIESADSSSTSIDAGSTTSVDSTVAATVLDTVAGSTSVVVTSLAPTPTAAPAPTAPPAPATTVAPPPPAPGTPLGAPTFLQYEPDTIIMPAGFSCADGDPGIPGWTIDDCQEAPSYSNGVLVVTLHRNDDGRLAVSVLFQSAGQYHQRYFAGEEGPGILSAITVNLGDYHFDDGVEVWIGYRYQGTGQYLDLDVLDPLPDGSFFLGGLQGLDHGGVDLHPGGATVRDAIYGASDPGCCPSQIRHRQVFFQANQWLIDAGVLFPTASEPPLGLDL